MKLVIKTLGENGAGTQEKRDSMKQEGEPHRETSGIKCEIQEHEARYNLKGERIEKVVEGEKVEVDTKEGMEYAMRSYKYYSKEGGLESSMVEILSPHIIKALQTVIKEYPAVSLGGDRIIIQGEVKCIFHYRKELAAYADDLGDQVARSHVLLALRFMERELRQSIKVYKATVESATISPSTVFRDMWMIFRPGELVVTGHDEKTQVLQVVETIISPCQPPKWVVVSRMLTYDGKSFGYADQVWEVGCFEGSKPICELPIFPLKYHEDREELVEKLVTRGRKFCGLKGSHHRSYKGIAFALGRERNRNQFGQMDAFPLETVMVCLLRIALQLVVVELTSLAGRRPHHGGLQNVRRREITKQGYIERDSRKVITDRGCDITAMRCSQITKWGEFERGFSQKHRKRYRFADRSRVPAMRL